MLSKILHITMHVPEGFKTRCNFREREGLDQGSAKMLVAVENVSVLLQSLVHQYDVNCDRKGTDKTGMV